MTLSCLVTLSTSSGHGFAEVRINSLDQLALVMPASVVSYDVTNNGENQYPPMSDSELFDLLVGIVLDLDPQQSGG